MPTESRLGLLGRLRKDVFGEQALIGGLFEEIARPPFYHMCEETFPLGNMPGCFVVDRVEVSGISWYLESWQGIAQRSLDGVSLQLNRGFGLQHVLGEPVDRKRSHVHQAAKRFDPPLFVIFGHTAGPITATSTHVSGWLSNCSVPTGTTPFKDCSHRRRHWPTNERACSNQRFGNRWFFPW